MKPKSESVSKTKGNVLSKQVRGSDRADCSSDNDACPREQMIAEAAYFLAERRGFAPGNELADWYQAEADVKGLPQNGR